MVPYSHSKTIASYGENVTHEQKETRMQEIVESITEDADPPESGESLSFLSRWTPNALYGQAEFGPQREDCFCAKYGGYHGNPLPLCKWAPGRSRGHGDERWYIPGWRIRETGFCPVKTKETDVLPFKVSDNWFVEPPYWFQVSFWPNIVAVLKQSCGKVMFSQACVKNSVHRGEVYTHPLSPGRQADPPPDRQPPWLTTSGQTTPQANNSPWADTHPGQAQPNWADTPQLGKHSQADIPPTIRRPLKRTVSILLECILVLGIF